MENKRTTAAFGMRLAAAALCAAVATAGTGLACAFADVQEGGLTDPDAVGSTAETPAGTTAETTGEEAAKDAAPASFAAPASAVAVAATSLTAEQIAAEPTFATFIAAASLVNVKLGVTNDTQGAGDLYDAVDELRAAQGLQPLERDAALELCAYQRAAEGTLLLLDMRPDGSLYTTVEATGRIQAELLAQAKPEAGSTVGADDLLAGLTSQQLAVLTSATATNVGVAQVETDDGRVVWAVLTASDGLDGAGASVADGDAVYTVNVAAANVVANGAVGAVDLEAGLPQTLSIPATVTGAIAYGAADANFTETPVELNNAALTWNTSNSGVATVDASGTATGVASGTCTVSATGAAGQFLFDATVTGGEPVQTVDLADCTVAGVLATYEETGAAIEPPFSVIDASGVEVLPTQYTYRYENNVEPGEASIVIEATGAGNVTGAIVKTFEIAAQPAPAVTVLVPEVLGYASADAEAAIAAAGLTATVQEGAAAPDEASVGTVYDVFPVAGTELEEGSEVTVACYGPVASPGLTDIGGGTVELSPASATYTGAAIEPAVAVVISDETSETGYRTLTPGVDYTVTFENNVDVSTEGAPALVTVTGVGAYTGELTASFVISEAPATTTDLAAAGYSISPVADQTYTGSAITPAITLAGPGQLTSDDYMVSYRDNVAVGTATVTVTGQGEYSGMLTATFRIAGDIADAVVTAIPNQTYTGAEIKPSPVVAFGTSALTEGVDYDLSYENNVSASTDAALAKVVLTGRGSYTGAQVVEFVIEPKSIKGAQVAAIASVTYSGNANTPPVTVKDGSTTLVNGVDYTLSYERNVDAGAALVVIQGIGNYQYATDTTFVIAPANIARATVVMPNQYYTGQALTPMPVSVTLDGRNLVAGADFTMASYANNAAVGDATATLQGIGNYTGSVTANWKIVQSANGGQTDPGQTETIPKTGDSTDFAAMSLAGAAGVLALAGAAAIAVRRVRAGRREN